MGWKSIIKQAVVSLVTSDETSYPQGQATYNGKPTDHTRLSPYGLVSNPPKDSWVLLLSSMAQSAVKFGIASDMLRRMKGLKEGECGLYNTLTESFVLLKENNDIEVDSKGDILANATGNITATAEGDISATADGDISASATDIEATATGKIDLTAPTINLNGNVNFTGISVKHNGKEIGENHGHTQADDSAGNSEQPLSGVT